MCLLISHLLFGSALSAQTFTANLTGIITDPNAAVIAGAQLVLTNTATSELRRTTSNSMGRYSFPQILPATYTIRVTAEGFREYTRSGVELTTNQTAEINVQLVLGQVSEAIEVVAATPLLDTQTSNQSTTLSSQLVTELPVATRNPFSLVFATAGAVANNPNLANAVQDQNTTRWSLNGGRENAAQILIDGIPAVAGDWGGLLATPGIDSVQESQIIRNTYEAQYGKSGGGVVNVTTRGGSQQFHGTLFEYHQNDNLNANSFFNNKYGAAKTETKSNQFGGNFSGPIWRARRLYGFVGYDGLRRSNAGSRGPLTVPTLLERSGDFSQTFNPNRSLQVIYDPMSTKPDPARAGRFIRTPFAGNKIPSQRFDPVALNILKYTPTPNQPGDPITNVRNWFQAGPSITDNDRFDVRIDWARTDAHTLWWRLTKAQQEARPFQFWSASADTAVNQVNPRLHLSFGNTFIASPTMIVNVLLGVGRWKEQQFGNGYGFSFTELGLPASLASQIDVATPPQIGLGGLTLGNTRYLVAPRTIYSGQVNVSKEFTTHSLRFGGTFEPSLMNHSNANAAFFTFNNLMTAGPDPDTRATTVGNATASFLLGTGANGRAPKAMAAATNDLYWALYVQDAWKVNRRLTLNYGIRYEVQAARTERYNRLNYFDFNIASPIAAAAGIPSLRGGLVYLDSQNRHVWETPYNNFAPRVGLAYRVTDKFVVRAGYGIFYMKNVNQSAATSSTGYSLDTQWVTSQDAGKTPHNLLRNPFPEGISQPTGSSGGASTQVGASLSAYSRKRPTPYMQQYSLDLQYQVGKDTMIELGYAGSQGRKLGYGFAFEMNQIPDAALAMGDASRDLVPNPFYGVVPDNTSIGGPTIARGQLLRPYPQFTGVSINDMPGASSSFNAFTANLTKRYSNGLTLIGSYRFSKAIDNASESISFGTGDRGRNFNNMSLDRSLSSHDRPHLSALTFIYALPFGKGRPLGAGWNRMVDAMLGGWSVSGMYHLESGHPLNFSAPNNVTWGLGGGQYPDINDRSLLKLDHPTPERWFNTGAVTNPADYTFGNAPRWVGEVRSDYVNNMDMAVMKTFTAREKAKVTLRGEFFNTFNRNCFGNPNTSFGNKSFGVVSGSAALPRQIQVAIRVAF